MHVVPSITMLDFSAAVAYDTDDQESDGDNKYHWDQNIDDNGSD